MLADPSRFWSTYSRRCDSGTCRCWQSNRDNLATDDHGRFRCLLADFFVDRHASCAVLGYTAGRSGSSLRGLTFDGFVAEDRTARFSPNTKPLV